MQPFKFAYSTINWGVHCDLPAAFAEISGAGWGAIELFGHSLDQLGPADGLRAELGSLLPATVFSIIELPVDREQSEPSLIGSHGRPNSALISLASSEEPGCGTVRRPTTNILQSPPIWKSLPFSVSRSGVTVAYHPHVACTIETSAEIEQLMERTSLLRLCLDASHIALVDEDPITVLNTWWDRIGYIHLKDWGMGKFRELGQGSIGIDFPTILAYLGKREYRGWVVLEQSQSDDSPLASAKLNAAFLNGLGYRL